MIDNLFIFDCEVFAYDWLFSFKNKVTKERTKIWNDNEAVKQFMKQEPLLAGFNNKHYDQFILKAVLCDFTPEQIKAVNDFIILEGHEGWEYAPLRDCGIFFDQYDLMDDCQMGLSLKAIEAHLGMDIRETTVSFDIDRPLTEQEKDEVEFYCDHDVDATDTLDDLRQGYLSSKLTLGKEKGIYPAKALYMCPRCGRKKPIVESPMFTVFSCRKCEHLLFVEEDSDFPQKLAKVAGMSCPNCGEREEGLWRLLGRADEFEGTIFVEEQDDHED